MKCKFCGEEINKDDIRCASCGGELERITDPEENLKIIDEMPELHDELDKIGKIPEKKEGTKKRVILSVVIVLACLLASFLGMYFVKHQKPAKPVNEEIVLVSSKVPGSLIKITEGQGFTDVLVTDDETAESAINSLRSRLGITDERTSYRIKSKHTVGTDTYYRFWQYCGNVRVYDGEMVIMADANGVPLMVNGVYVETDGVELTAEVNKGKASNDVTDYINKLPDDYCLKDGVSISDPEKIICNFEESTYLAYMFRVSGYNENGGFIAYDVFIDADAGNGICYHATSSYENEDMAVETIAETPVIRDFEESLATYYVVNDKFNWNDETKTSAKEPISTESINLGETSPYIKEAKASVDRAHTYFKDNFAWIGEPRVYINSNEYVETEIPPEKAIYSDGVITFIEEDLINVKLDDNVATHEYSHMVMQDIAYLNGTMAFSENSVISEGYADVFGELSEIYFKGSADFIHGERNIKEPFSPYLTATREDVTAKDISSVYYNSTIISNALYKIHEGGLSDRLLGELMFRSLCMMNKTTSFSEWRAITEATLYQMMERGVISGETFNRACDALINTGISAEKLYVTDTEIVNSAQ